MKTVVIGDTHAHYAWREVLKTEDDWGRVIFLGDYFDTFQNKTAASQLGVFKDIVSLIDKHPDREVVLLIGNHDIHYFPEIATQATSGFSYSTRAIVSPYLDLVRSKLKVAYSFDDFIFSHAGISSEFMDRRFKDWSPKLAVGLVNSLHLKELLFCGYDPYGDDTYQTPIWIRPASLIRANKEREISKYKQVVGHTNMKKPLKSDNYYFLDCMGGGYYGVIENGELEFRQIDMNSFVF